MQYFTTSGSFDFARTGDPLIDAAFAQGETTLNTTTRARAYMTPQGQSSKDAAWIPLFYMPQVATTDGRVRRFQLNPGSAAGAGLEPITVGGQVR
jgi:ABC-type oligopeptide transport system substrate-binding subunit